MQTRSGGWACFRQHTAPPCNPGTASVQQPAVQHPSCGDCSPPCQSHPPASARISPVPTPDEAAPAGCCLRPRMLCPTGYENRSPPYHAAPTRTQDGWEPTAAGGQRSPDGGQGADYSASGLPPPPHPKKCPESAVPHALPAPYYPPTGRSYPSVPDLQRGRMRPANCKFP